MIAFGILLALAGYLVWHFDLGSTNMNQLRWNALGQLVALPRWWGLLAFFVMWIGVLIAGGAILLAAFRLLP